ncbi:UBP1-associated protein 2B-like [Tasmannia lanceolata]|uniref:UBP1-associated protein 2B-like n=1 Tax=Tasmannia lanceolata TaxID=3420 RepID=UPI004064253A
MAKKRKIEPKTEPKTEPEFIEPKTESEFINEDQEQDEEQNPPEEEVEVEEDQEDEDETLEDVSEQTEITTTTTAATATATGTAPPTTTADGEEVEESDSESDSESVLKLLEPFPKEQLIDLLRSAAIKHSDILESINKIADVDPSHRKIFVHGLGWDTNAETLTNVFKKYGEIEDVNAVCDKISGKSKGYGFILFKNRSGARKALKQPQKRIGSRMTACQLASSGPVPAVPAAVPVSEYTQRKIYVSNVSADIDPQRLLQFFAKFGEIEEGPLGLDKQTGKPKGFALFVYKTAESVRKALEEPHKNYEGHTLHCQKAIDGPKPNKGHYHHHPPGGGQFKRNENPNFMGGMGNHSAAGPGHLMAPSPGMNFNQAVPQAAINPALGQALTALLATQGAGLGLNNLLGSMGSGGMAGQVNQNVPQQMVNNAGHGMQGGYGNQAMGGNLGANVMGGYGSQPQMQGGYPNQPMGQANAGRSQQGAGHMGGGAPYMGH